MVSPSLSCGFPWVFLWFSYGVPMVFLWFSNVSLRICNVFSVFVL